MRRRELLKIAGTVVLGSEKALAQAVGPTAAQKAWIRLGYGLFLQFGRNTLGGVGWGDGKFPPGKFAPGKLDCAQWADVAGRLE